MTDVIGRAKVIVTSEVDARSPTDAGTKMGNLLGGALKKTAIGVAGSVGALVGATIFKGFQRLSSIEEAEAKLKGLGNSAKTVSTVMESALNAVKGTAFGLGDAASIAASAVASGVKPGQELERTLRLIADASTIAGTDLSEMGAVFNKVAATGKAQTDVLNQLGDRGIPIVQLLAKELNITSEQVYEFAKDGKINFETFQKAIEEGMGGAALESGQTFRGALANAGAALGRFGAALLGPSFKEGPDVFAAITEKLDELTPAARRAGEKIADFAEAIKNFQKSKDWQAIQKDMKTFGKDVLTLAGAVGKLFTAFDKLSKFATGKSGLRVILDGLQQMAENVAPISKLADAVNLVAKAWKAVASAMEKVHEIVVTGPDIPDAPDISQPRSTRAGGGTVRGLALVGENGPELAQFGDPGGYVYNNSQTKQILAGMSGDTINNYWQFFGPESLSQARQQEDWSRSYGTRFGSATRAVTA